MFRRLAATALLILIPATLPADSPTAVRLTLESAIAAYEAGDTHEALQHIRHARQAIVSEASDIPPGVLPNLAEIEQALAAYGICAYGRRPDFDATHDAVLRVIGELRIAYHGSHRVFGSQGMDVDLDMDGRIRELGDMHFDYVSFSDRLRKIGTIDIDYVSFSKHPRKIGAIEFDWSFGKLRRVAGVDVDRCR